MLSSTVYRALALAGIPRYARGRARRPDHAALALAYRAGETVTELRVQYGITRASVYAWLKHAAVPTRGRSRLAQPLRAAPPGMLEAVMNPQRTHTTKYSPLLR
ncbi:MAG: hypothetical protein ACYDCQ_19995 [Dehalococcoidia bacterium]